MTIQTALKLMRQKLNEHGLYHWTAKVNTNKRRFGVCKYRYNRIEVSAYHLRQHSDDEILDTILHEIAHALVGPKHGHDNVWRSRALEIGCNGNRCADDALEVEHSVVGTCKDCQTTFKRHKMPIKRTLFHKTCRLQNRPNAGNIDWKRV